jgi:hypothetical protein
MALTAAAGAAAIEWSYEIFDPRPIEVVGCKAFRHAESVSPLLGEADVREAAR